MLRLAQRYNFYDLAGARKVHSGAKACLGGGAVFFAFVVSSLILQPLTTNSMLLLGGGAYYFLLGLLDDRFDLPARYKLCAELLVTTTIVWGGMQCDLFLKNPFGSIGFHPIFMLFSIPFSVLWIVGIANAVNIIDGLDALASGVVLIACIALSAAALMNPAVSLSPYLVILIGSIAGYIRHNLYPSRIIMGDSGALFLGYIIAMISLGSFANADRSIFLALIPPAMALYVPIADTLMAVYRRRKNGRAIFSADKNHLHHCLLDRGYSHPVAVRIVWVLSAIFGALALVLSELIYRQIYLALALLLTVSFWTVITVARLGLLNLTHSGNNCKAKDVRLATPAKG